MGFPPHSLSPAELVALRAMEERGEPFLAWRELGDLRFLGLGSVSSVTAGRAEGNDVVLAWDREVSRTHFELSRVGAAWTVSDDGLSRNGCFLNGERVLGRRRLRDGDVLRVGRTALVFRAPVVGVESTAAASAAEIVRLTEAERRVLVALCVPLLVAGGAPAAPAPNAVIADRLSLTSAGVKTHIRSLFRKLDVEDLPQNAKRAELARRALDAGLVTIGDARD